MTTAILDNYNDWIVNDKEIIKRKGKNYLKCKCKCGLEKEVYLYSLRNNLSKRCSSCAGKTIELSELFKNTWNGNGVGTLSGTMFSHIKQKAKERNLEFNLTKEFLWSLFCKQKEECALSGLPITLSIKLKNNNPNFEYITASLDRKDSNKGYTEQNVQWVHKDVNKMKMQYDNDYFIKICKLIGSHN